MKLSMYRVTIGNSTATCMAVGRREAALKAGTAYRIQHKLPSNYAVLPTVQEVRPKLTF